MPRLRSRRSVSLRPTANAIKAELPGVPSMPRCARNAPATTDNSYRWLIGEDSTAFGGALRDMWTPTCFGNPGKVSDREYHVHGRRQRRRPHRTRVSPTTPSRSWSTAGRYNGQTSPRIGLTKAAHIYYRAMSVYQGPASDFADHADALEQSCSDLIGRPLTRV